MEDSISSLTKRMVLALGLFLAATRGVRSEDAAPHLAAAATNAEKVSVATRAQRRLNLLPDEIKQDLIQKFESDKEALEATKKHVVSSVHGKPTSISSSKLNSLNSRLMDISDVQSVISNSVSNAAPLDAAIATAITYKPEYLLPTLNPTFAICNAHIWNKPGFPYQAQLDKNAGAIVQLSQAVGLFASYRQTNKPGLPAPADMMLASAGTGVAIATNLVLTNQHVAANMVTDPTIAPKDWQLKDTTRFIIRFPVETTACSTAMKSVAFEVAKLVYVGLGPTYEDDIAVLQVLPLDGGALQPVAFAADSYSGDEYLGVIGYPDRPDPSDYVPPAGNGLFPDAIQLDAYFDLPNNQLPKYRVERFGFGTLVDLKDPDMRFIGHDAPTDNSSSGSLVVALDTGKPIALHAGGNLGTGPKSGVNIAYRGDYILTQLREHGVLPP